MDKNIEETAQGSAEGRDDDGNNRCQGWAPLPVCIVQRIMKWTVKPALNHLHLDQNIVCGFVTQWEFGDHFTGVVFIQFEFVCGIQAAKINEIQVE